MKSMYREDDKGKMTSCLGESSSCESQPGAVDGEDKRMDVMLADMHVELAEDLHRPGLRYTILLIILRRE